MNKSRFLYIASVHTLVVALILISYLLITMIYPYKIVELHNSPFPTNKDVYEAGEVVYYELSFTKNYNFKPEITHYLVDGFIYKLSAAGLARPVGKQTHRLGLVIPETTPPGRYRLQIDLAYKVNSFRQINYSWQSQEFEVVKGGEE